MNDPNLEGAYEPIHAEPAWSARWLQAQAFSPRPRADGRPFVVLLPPPNVTGSLHLGHVLSSTIQDVFVRYQRMRGREALWWPGTDHAGIATQKVVERSKETFWARDDEEKERILARKGTRAKPQVQRFTGLGEMNPGTLKETTLAPGRRTLLQVTIGDVFFERGMERPVATVLTLTRVRPDDPAFADQTKPIGPFYPEERARLLAKEKGWTIVEDAGRGYRRVVPSPQPLEVIEIDAIRGLVDDGIIVIAGGGGGIPVSRQWDGTLHGVEAVIDKDLASSLLARLLGCDTLVIVTGVDRVAVHFKKPEQRDLDLVTVAELERFQKEGHFPEGSAAQGRDREARTGVSRRAGRRHR